MSISRPKFFVLSWALALLWISTATAQTQQYSDVEQYFGPENGDLQLFKPSDLSTYGNGPKPHYGYFGSYEGLVWTISNPNTTAIGKNGLTRFVSNGNTDTSGGNFFNGPPPPNRAGVVDISGNPVMALQTNDANNGFIHEEGMFGSRVEFGYISCDTNHGWMVSAFNLQNNIQTFNGSDIGVAFAQPETTVINPQTGLPVTVGLLSGFVDFTGAISPTTGLSLQPDGIPDDVNHNHVFGNRGTDFGTAGGTPIGQTYTVPFDNIPDPNPFQPLPTGTTPPPFPAVDPSLATDYGDLVPLAVYFKHLQARQLVNTWGTEVMYMWRKPPRKQNVFEIMAGWRYFSFKDEFRVTAEGGLLDESRWINNANNRITGPQIAMRWEGKARRFSFGAEGRFMPGLNSQAIRQQSDIGSTIQSNLPPSNPPETRLPAPGLPIAGDPNYPFYSFATGANHRSWLYEFSPLAEVRFNMTYEVWRHVSLTAGYNAIYVGGIARASNTIDYTLPSLGILDHNNQMNVFMQGISFGLRLNR